ncbi:WD40 repeat-like protein [Mycena maculata]|uniref:WD40 repeat-like protein n=1 Tax=Mycena maculata TaxID=230809 RepID=A0AAD7MVY1_9AGAR|nr:WD40 repeat-like protein [Mycena maculata]
MFPSICLCICPTEYADPVQLEALKSLKPLDYDGAHLKECLPGTRTEIISQITDWVATAFPIQPQPTQTTEVTASRTPNVLWLNGVAGAGKSTISTTVSETFRSMERLGAYLFFQRSNTVGSNPASVIRTIAYRLAESNRLIRSAIAAAITDQATLVSAPIHTQFQKLLLEPLSDAQAHVRGPFIIILDALDECGNAESRSGLVSLIATEFHKLPSMFRFFITSRPDSDIARQFRGQPHIRELRLDITTASTKNDIVAYLQHMMENIRKDKELELNWPGETVIQRLADNSGGLFIWASTACKFIQAAVWDVEERLHQVLAPEYGVGHRLDDLYRVALQTSVKWDDNKVLPVAQAILGVILVARVPLTDEVLDDLLDLGKIKSCKILEHLGCVVQWSPGQPAQRLHASFGDYLTDYKRSGSDLWFIDFKIHHGSLAVGCLRVLNQQLRFNICGLEDSCLLNSQVPDLLYRIEQCISPALSYASTFWAIHLDEADPNDTRLLPELKYFMHNHFLHWLEILSLLDKVSVGIMSMNIAHNYVQSRNTDFQDLLHDASRFLAVFAPVVAESVPHIYISAIPFAPMQSPIHQQYISSLPQTTHMDGQVGEKWPRLLKALTGHGLVNSVAFSPNGKQIVCGSDNTVHVWDSETGVPMLELEHTANVSSVAFSPDSKFIVSGSHDSQIRIWDSSTGAMMVELLEGDTGVVAVAFSPDGKHIASGSTDSKICVWDWRSGKMAAGPLNMISHVISRPFPKNYFCACPVDFSPDGRWIVSGSNQGEIQVWDSTSGAIVTGPFPAHVVYVNSVAFSPDGRQIASGGDNTISVWDTTTGARVAGPFLGHTQGVVSVAFSPNGIYIVSGSFDNTMRVWDLASGRMAANPFEHLHWVNSVAFSPDGTQIVSGCADHAVRMWGFDTGDRVTVLSVGHATLVGADILSLQDSTDAVSASFETVGLPNPMVAISCKEHTEQITSVAFSPDGTLIVSGSLDHTSHFHQMENPTGALMVLITMPCDAHKISFYSVAYSPDGTRIVSTSGTQICMWDSVTGDLIDGPFTGHTGLIRSVGFSPDGTRIVSGSMDNTIRVWDSTTGALVAGPFDAHGPIQSVLFSPDGTQIISGGNDMIIRVWDPHPNALTPIIRSFKGHTNTIESVAFSPDGTWIVSGSQDRTIRVWDSATGAMMAGPFPSSDVGGTCAVAFSPDGTRIVSAAESRIAIWKLTSEPWGRSPRFEDGWMMAGESYMLWIPPWLRKDLWLPWNPVNIPVQGTIKLDLTQFVYGTKWQECIQARS